MQPLKMKFLKTKDIRKFMEFDVRIIITIMYIISIQI